MEINMLALKIDNYQKKNKIKTVILEKKTAFFLFDTPKIKKEKK